MNEVKSNSLFYNGLSYYLESFSAKELDFILKYSKVIKSKKCSMINNNVFQGNLCIVINGVIRHYSHSRNLKEQTLRFTAAPEILYSYYKESDNCEEVQMQSISNYALLIIPYEYLKEINVDFIFRDFTEKARCQKLEYENFLLRMTPEKRYQEFIKEYKNLLLAVPSKFIASFLCITPQALCRIRKRI